MFSRNLFKMNNFAIENDRKHTIQFNLSVMEILIGEKIHISQIGNSFAISIQNNINGKIIFNTTFGESKSYSLHKNLRKEFNITGMIEQRYLSFYPDFVEFESDDDLKSITIDLC